MGVFIDVGNGVKSLLIRVRIFSSSEQRIRSAVRLAADPAISHEGVTICYHRERRPYSLPRGMAVWWLVGRKVTGRD